MLGVAALIAGAALWWSGFLNLTRVPEDAAQPSEPKSFSGIEVIADSPHTLAVSEDARKTLGILKGAKEQIAIAQKPDHGLPLSLPGSTALNPSRVTHMRARFAPAEVVQVMQVQEPGPDGRTIGREIRPGDRVEKGDVLGVFFSIDVGNKKNDLIDALLSLDLHRGLLERAESVMGAVPEVFVMNARSLVLTDENAIRRAESTLRTWNISQEDIDAVHKEAAEIIKKQGKRDKSKESQWGRVELKAPVAGVLVERNVTLHEIVVDGTTNLFVLADVDSLLVRADVHEDDLHKVESLSPAQRKWTVQTVGQAPISGSIDDIGYLIDPNQHTAPIKGRIDNSRGVLRGGQFITATIQLPAPADVVEIPITAVVEDGKQCLIFVQPDPGKPNFTMRRVLISHRFDLSAFVRSRLTRKEQQALAEPDSQEGSLLPLQPLAPGERVLTTGVMELKAALEDKESSGPVGKQEESAR